MSLIVGLHLVRVHGYVQRPKQLIITVVVRYDTLVLLHIRVGLAAELELVGLLATDTQELIAVLLIQVGAWEKKRNTVLPVQRLLRQQPTYH
jgi:hypothetical protein